MTTRRAFVQVSGGAVAAGTAAAHAQPSAAKLEMSDFAHLAGKPGNVSFPDCGTTVEMKLEKIDSVISVKVDEPK